jgi:hypothetical protein
MPAPALPAADTAWCPGRLLRSLWSDASRLAAAIVPAREGVLVLQGTPRPAPFGGVRALFDSVTPARAARANSAYNGGGTRPCGKARKARARGVRGGPGEAGGLGDQRMRAWPHGAPHSCEPRPPCTQTPTGTPTMHGPSPLPNRTRAVGGRPSVDNKRVIGLSPPPCSTMEHHTTAAACNAVPIVVATLGAAMGCGAYSMEEALLAYRWV